MKPLRLTVEGFTAFRDRAEVDFAGLDLFAITGPTGAGKSSLIDAIVFALYGQVPRVGDDYKQLISHGAERLSVLFEFAVGTARHRVTRTARRVGASQQRLERLGAKGWDPVADKAREIRAEVERVLGLDYEAFTRSVVLPQGQFDAFLNGAPTERRKILVALLNLGVYERMLQLANQRATAARTEADFIRKQLETDYAGASSAALAERRAELAVAETAVQKAAAALAALANGAELAQSARAARREMAAVARDAAEEAKAAESAQAAIEGADAARATSDAALEELRQKVASVGFDEARHATLVAVRPVATQLVSQRAQLDRATRAMTDKRHAADAARTAVGEAEASLPGAETAERVAREAERAAREAREAAHRQDAAAALRRDLKPGDPCPVCEQRVMTVTNGVAPDLDAAETRARNAEAEARAATETLHALRLRVEQLRSTAQSLGREATQLEDQENSARASVAMLVAELVRSGFGEADAADPAGLGPRIQAEIQQLEAARRARAELEAERQRAEQRRAGLEASLAAARALRDATHARLEALRTRREEVMQRLNAALRALLSLASREGWTGLEAPPVGRDEADLLEAQRIAAQRVSAEGAARVATLKQAILSIEKALVRVAELGEKRKALEKEAALHKTLGDHLRANELVAWIQEEGLLRLAAEGSRHLARLSQGRYALQLGPGVEEEAARAEQEFFAVDHWNGDSARSVKTLSGGETFLASLALALALAEGLAELSTGGRATEALESLFLDEGFGALDSETLDVVVSALDALHSGQRMVGIVTHVRDLAERLPARIEVRRQGTASAVTVS
jgi:exonuclease SbcC